MNMETNTFSDDIFLFCLKYKTLKTSPALKGIILITGSLPILINIDSQHDRLQPILFNINFQRRGEKIKLVIKKRNSVSRINPKFVLLIKDKNRSKEIFRNNNHIKIEVTEKETITLIYFFITIFLLKSTGFNSIIQPFCDWTILLLSVLV